jgi:magnesium-transporting ATPase (P-type)
MTSAPGIPPTTTGPDALTALQVNADTGLTQVEVAARRAAHGFNEVTERKGHPALAFLGKFWGMSAWMLELIMVLSAVLQKYSLRATPWRSRARSRGKSDCPTSRGWQP